MRKIIVRIWIVILLGICFAYFPREKVGTFFKENHSVDAIWTKLSKPCPECEHENCQTVVYNTQDSGNVWTRGSTDSMDIYRQGQESAMQLIIQRLVEERKATITYENRKFKVTVEEIRL